MNKAELAATIASRCNLTKKQGEDAVEAFAEIVTSTLKSGGEVTIAGFGAFMPKTRKGRIGVNPRDPSKKITVPPVTVAKFKAGKNLKDTLKGKM